MSHDEIVDVVDENDNVLFSCERKKTFTENLRSRIVHCFLIDQVTQKIVLMIRSRNSSFRPLHYAAVGGYVQSGEDFATGIAREVQEEAGITVPLTFLAKGPAMDISNEKVFIDAVFAGVIHSADIRIDEKDFEGFELLTLEEVQKIIDEHPKVHPLLPAQFAVFKPYYLEQYS